MQALISLIRLLLLSLLVLGLAACSSLPQIDRSANATEAIALSRDSALGKIASSHHPVPNHSGFRLMPLGSCSLDTRIQLAQRSQVSRDVRRYHLHNDESGRSV